MVLKVSSCLIIAHLLITVNRSGWSLTFKQIAQLRLIRFVSTDYRGVPNDMISGGDFNGSQVASGVNCHSATLVRYISTVPSYRMRRRSVLLNDEHLLASPRHVRHPWVRLAQSWMVESPLLLRDSLIFSRLLLRIKQLLLLGMINKFLSLNVVGELAFD